MRIAHLSDLHIARRPRREEFNLKRSLGYVNFKLFRCRRYHEEVAVAAIAMLAEEEVDLVLLTGDTTQLGLDEEFDAAERMLAPLIRRNIPIITVSGNHDIYGEASRRRFQAFAHTLLQGLTPDQYGIYRFNGVDVLPLEQSIDNPPFLSVGLQGLEELELADKAWPAPPEGVMRLVLGHYPVIDPHGGRLMFLHGLRQRLVLSDFCERHRVGGYFCGHNHKRFTAVMPGGCMQFSAPALSDNRWAGHEGASVYLCLPDARNPVELTSHGRRSVRKSRRGRRRK